MNDELIKVLNELKEWLIRIETFNVIMLEAELDRLIKLYGGRE